MESGMDSSVLEGGEHLERDLAGEPFAAPAVGSLVLHIALALFVGYYAWILGFLHRDAWGNPGAGGAMQVNLVSNALPLPAEQVNRNVLATETPSQAPATPSPKEQHQIDETAIPIAGRNAKPQQKNTPKTQKQQPTPQQNRAAYGEQAGSIMPRAMPQSFGSNGVSVANGDFGSRFGWYVQIIKQRVDQNWYRAMVDPRTPKGATAQIYFRLNRQGAPSNFRVNTSSGSPTLDRSCLAATQRVDTFGTLPADSHDAWLDVTYDCTY